MRRKWFCGLVFIFMLIRLQAQDSILHTRYKIHEAYVFEYCTHCRDTAPELLCGHVWKGFSAGYRFHNGTGAEISAYYDYGTCHPHLTSHFVSASVTSGFHPNPYLGLKATYLRDQFPNVKFLFFKFGMHAEYMSDSKKQQWALRPEIRLADNQDVIPLLRRVHLSYAVNVLPLHPGDLNPFRHQFSIILTLFRTGWIS